MEFSGEQVAIFGSIAFIAIKVINTLVDTIVKKIMPDKDQVLRLSPEFEELLKQLGDKIQHIDSLVSKTDNEGIPMVYSSRVATETMRKVSQDLESVSRSQLRLAETMSNLERRFEAHDKEDHVFFARIADTMSSIASTAIANRESLIRFSMDHENALKKLDSIQEEFREHDRRVMAAVALQQDIKSKLE